MNTYMFILLLYTMYVLLLVMNEYNNNRNCQLFFKNELFYTGLKTNS